MRVLILSLHTDHAELGCDETITGCCCAIFMRDHDLKRSPERMMKGFMAASLAHGRRRTG